MGLNSLFDKLPLNHYIVLESIPVIDWLGILEKVLNHYIVLESIPVYSDNAKAVYEELLRREYNKKYIK